MATVFSANNDQHLCYRNRRSHRATYLDRNVFTMRKEKMA